MAETPGKNNPRAQHASQPVGKSNNPRHSQPVGANNPRNSQPLGKATNNPRHSQPVGSNNPRHSQPVGSNNPRHSQPLPKQPALEGMAAAHGRAQPLFPRSHRRRLRQGPSPQETPPHSAGRAGLRARGRARRHRGRLGLHLRYRAGDERGHHPRGRGSLGGAGRVRRRHLLHAAHGHRQVGCSRAIDPVCWRYLPLRLHDPHPGRSTEQEGHHGVDAPRH